jgi:UDP-N-acetyl-D-glucosamine dehydrogenase
MHDPLDNGTARAIWRGQFPRPANRQTVCVQGLGFVGTAMAIAVANARDEIGEFLFDVIGVDLPTPEGQSKVDAVNAGKLPLATTDEELVQAFETAVANNTLTATTDPCAYQLADVTIVDIHLDVIRGEDGQPTVRFDGFRKAMSVLGQTMRPGSLVVVETTVPPGTCEYVVRPTIAEALQERGLPEDAILIAHSYERVMPGKEYYRSIVNFWRVFSGTTEAAADACEAFLSKVIHTKEYPLRRLHATTASETAKVLENSYRATNIAFIEEWGQFAESVGIDLFEVIDAVRVRPTHSNIRQPGFGVGGYCLTKDPLLAGIGARELFGIEGMDFPFSSRAVEVNAAMPKRSVEILRQQLGSIHGKRILLLGVSYRQDVADTRYSPSEVFVNTARAEGAEVVCHDPLVAFWTEQMEHLPSEIPEPHTFDAVVFAVPHREYQEMDVTRWLGDARPLILDANNVLTEEQRLTMRQAGCPMAAVGRGNH